MGLTDGSEEGSFVGLGEGTVVGCVGIEVGSGEGFAVVIPAAVKANRLNKMGNVMNNARAKRR